jgi:DNA-binding SARP family transcriptional activator
MAGGHGAIGARTRVPRADGLSRERLDRKLATLWGHRLGLIVAPAGSGKTTLLAQFATSATAAGVPTAWWRAEASDSSEAAAVAHLERAMVPSLGGGLAGGWSSVDDVAAALDGWRGERALVAVDDFHSLWGTEAEAAIERLLSLLPPSVVLLASTRRAPGFNLPRLLVSGHLLEVGPEDLRFRPWEVERLFRDFYGEPMLPQELAELARRTHGWAAGLQLFHLATRGKPAAERRRMLGQLGHRSKLLREYLARNLLDELPVHVRDFLVRTCVLGRLTAPLCDALTGATSSDALLDELVQRQIFTAVVDDEGSYRYHEVLRSHLEGVLVEQVGETEARARFRRAGELLEHHGYLADAIRAYGRAEAWEAVTRLLGVRAEEVVDRPGDWIEALPSALLEHDPWLLLGIARRYVSLGRADAAIDAYRRAESASGGEPGQGPGQPGESCRRERQAVATWFSSAPPNPSDWIAALRRATVGAPRLVAQRAASSTSAFPWRRSEGELVAGLCALLAGDVRDAEARLSSVASGEDVSTVVALAASLGAAAARVLAGAPVVAEADRIGEHADAVGVPWLAAMARAVALADRDAPGDLRAAGLPKDDPWGSALSRLFAGVGALRRPDDGDGLDAAAVLADAGEAFRDLDAPVLAAWSSVAHAAAVARRGDRGAALALRRAAQHAAQLGVDASCVTAGVVVVPASMSSVSSVSSVSSTSSVPVPSSAGGPRLQARCFGSFQLTVDGTVVDLSVIKPRVRSLLRLLALQGGASVHRERIIELLWPDESDVKVGTRNLQVAVSSLRQLVEPGVGRGEASMVVRDGDTYRLAFDGDDATDVGAFRRAVDAARTSRTVDACRAALDAYTGDLLVDEGPAEWVTAERDRCRLAAADVAQWLAEAALADGDTDAAVDAAERGLRVDSYRDGLWRTLIAAYDAAGDRAASGRAAARYRDVLDDLGV